MISGEDASIFGDKGEGGTFIAQSMALPSSFTDLFMVLPYVLTLLLLIFFSKS